MRSRVTTVAILAQACAWTGLLWLASGAARDRIAASGRCAEPVGSSGLRPVRCGSCSLAPGFMEAQLVSVAPVRNDMAASHAASLG